MQKVIRSILSRWAKFKLGSKTGGQLQAGPPAFSCSCHWSAFWWIAEWFVWRVSWLYTSFGIAGTAFPWISALDPNASVLVILHHLTGSASVVCPWATSVFCLYFSYRLHLFRCQDLLAAVRRRYPVIYILVSSDDLSANVDTLGWNHVFSHCTLGSVTTVL